MVAIQGLVFEDVAQIAQIHEDGAYIVPEDAHEKPNLAQIVAEELSALGAVSGLGGGLAALSLDEGGGQGFGGPM